MPQPAFPSRRELLMLAALAAGHLIWSLLWISAAYSIHDRNLFSNDSAYAICFGSVAAQLVLLAAWTALGPGSHLARVSGSMLFVYFAGYVTAIFTDGFDSGDTSYVHVTIVIIAVLIAFFVLQLPLWLFRFVWGWRIVPREMIEASASEPRGRLSILHLLGWTVFAATLLAMSQVFSHSESNGIDSLGSLLAAAAIGVAVQLVFLWIVLSPERQSLFTKAAIILVVSGCATAGVYICIGLFSPMRVVGEEWIYVSLGVAYCTLLVGTLLIVRACGYRLAMASGERKLPDSA